MSFFVRTCMKSLLLIVIGFTVSVMPAATALELIRKTSSAAIVIPAEAGPYEKFAAEELQTLLLKSTGVALPIVADNSQEITPAIFIGAHPANAALAAKLNEFSTRYDRFAWECKNDRIFITAPSNSALSYAVWDFLEKTTGIDFLIPGEMGAYIPRLDELNINDRTVLEAPAFDFRSYSINADSYNPDEHGFNAGEMFRFRNRFNMWRALDPADTYGWLGSGHSYNHFLPITRYAAEHPEWFNLQADGSRKTTPENGWQLCLTNAESAREFIQNAIPEIEGMKARGIPEERILLCAGANDTVAWCLCEPCQALRDPDGTWSSAVLNYTNLLARELAKTHPKVKVLHYVYSDYGRIPSKVAPAPGVAACITSWTADGSLAVNHTASMFDPVKNAICKAVGDYFAAHCRGIMNYGYYGHYSIFVPFPMVRQIAGDMRGLAAYSNVTGSLSETHNMWATQSPNFYIHAKMMWDPSQDEYELLANYCRKYFGPAGELGFRYFDLLQQRMNSLDRMIGTTAELPAFLDRDVLARCRSLIDAMKPMLAEMDEATRFRTQMVIDGFSLTEKFVEAMELFNWGNDIASRNKILENIAWIENYCQSPVGRFAFEYPMVEGELNQIRMGLQADLLNLPEGNSRFGGSLMWGGGVKFYAVTDNMRPDMWGYLVPAGGTGTLKLPLQAAAGRRITGLNIWCVPDKAETDLYVVADGTEHLVARKLDNYRQVSIPAELLGCNRLEVVFKSKVEQANQYGLCGLNLEMEVR
ncbi:DUF4838 domain-containing protein [Victivallis vadensis]|uniref:DUF4838 domain-containing protein n=1 Tax=Victivallis vadensis TaxID=172901 RepID=UPI0026DBE273|nr:DUF4838 domain-containing protein [Victivallis vadensis]